MWWLRETKCSLPFTNKFGETFLNIAIQLKLVTKHSVVVQKMIILGACKLYNWYTQMVSRTYLIFSSISVLFCANHKKDIFVFSRDTWLFANWHLGLCGLVFLPHVERWQNTIAHIHITRYSHFWLSWNDISLCHLLNTMTKHITHITQRYNHHTGKRPIPCQSGATI